MNRIDRISAILIQLQSKKIVRAEDIAERFAISNRTVYRDIKTIIEAGVPLISEPGVGYSIMDGYRLPPIHFTVEEATAFLTAEKLMEKIGDEKMGDHYNAAMYKIRAVLKSQDKEYLETIENVIQVKENRYLPRNITEKNILDLVLKCIYKKHQLLLEYKAGYTLEESKRTVEAIGIVFQNGNWLLIAYCHLRKDYRTFRMDRILKSTALEKSFEAVHPPLEKFLEHVSREKELTKIVIEIPQKTLHYLGDQKYYMGFVSQEVIDDKIRLTFLAYCTINFSRWLISYGDIAEILEPISLKEQVIQLLESQLEKHRQVKSTHQICKLDTARLQS